MSGPEYKSLGGGGGQTVLSVEWTNQHGCGGNEDTDPHKQNCNLVLQYMCQEDVDKAEGNAPWTHTSPFIQASDYTMLGNGPREEVWRICSGILIKPTLETVRLCGCEHFQPFKICGISPEQSGLEPLSQ